MTRLTETLLQEIVEAIVNEVDPDKVILFGSQARGEAHEHSDIDLVVLEAEPFGNGRSRHSEEVRIRRALSSFHVSKDILVYSQEDVEHWQDSLNHLLARALREGRVVYERC